MSKYSQYKNDTYLANLNYANSQKERRNKEELKEIEQDRIAMEKLQIELEQEKQLVKERKNQIRQQQYEDYSNYFKQKYSEVPQSKENMNIKLGTEQRFIRKPSYQQQMENLCLNPTRNTNVFSHTPTPNFSEQGRRYQRGYSHGYNILTGEVYSPELQQGKINNQNNQNMNRNNNSNNNYNLNNQQKEQLENNYEKNNQKVIIDEKEKEELRQYQEYMEMKRQKEQEEREQAALYYMQQNQNKYPPQQEREIEKEIIDQNENIAQFPNTLQPRKNYHNDYSPQEQLYDKMNLNQNELPPEDKDNYNKERIEPKQMEQIPLEEIPPEYREAYMREQMKEQNQNRRTPYQNQQREEINNDYMPKQNEEIKPKENENALNNEKNSEQDYRQYLLSKQEINNKEKEEENMEIYQNMLREKEREQNEINQEREKELYRQYLLEQQRQNSNNTQFREEYLNQNQINQISENQNEQYQDIKNIKEQEIPKEIINERNNNNNNDNNKPINSFDEYYRQKNMNNPEIESEIKNKPQTQLENKYENDNYPPYSQYPPENIQNPNIYPQQEEPISEEQAYMMYQEQQKRKELEKMEMEKERARQILERQQKERLNQEQSQIPNDYYQQNYNKSTPYNKNNNNKESPKLSEFNSAKIEYLKNRQKNLLTKDNIFSVSETPKPQPKYNNEPLTNADRLRIQREYAQFLDSQINAKNMRENRNKNNGLNLVQSSGYEVEGPNPYEQMRNKHSKLRDIPQDPYSVKNYNISSNSYLASNPITNPVNSYKFVDKRRVPSGRLQNSGSNIVGK